MSNLSVQRGPGPTSTPSLQGLDAQTVLLFARRARVDQMQNQLDAHVSKFEALMAKHQAIGALTTTLQRFCAELDKIPGGTYRGDKMAELLRSPEWAKVARVAGEVGYNPKTGELKMPRVRHSQADSLRLLEASADVHAAKLEKGLDELKDSLRELASTLDYEMKAMQRSVRSEGNHVRAMG